MNRFIILISFIGLFCSCNNKRKLVNAKDFEVYLQPKFLQQEKNKLNAEIVFWQTKLNADTGSFLYKKQLAKLYMQSFKLSGNVNSIKSADSLLYIAAHKLNNKDAAILYSLSQNAITQHRFADARKYNLNAEQIDPNPYVDHLLAFDADMELGKYYEAFKKVNDLRDKSDFNYLIRKAKLEDHYGRLDKAIKLMEEAVEVMKDKRKSNYLWALSNLADMYGHAGRIQDSYNTYLNVLKEDSSNLYCLKGITWIAFSNDRNTAEAKRIINFILSQTNMPELLLTLAEVEEWDGNTDLKKEYLDAFLKRVLQPGYGDMYNKYLIHIYTEELKEYDKALELAIKETEHRPTPETYDWLAWVYFKKGEKQKAFKIAQSFVYKRTFEPGALKHTAYIFEANGKTDEAKKLFEECLDASFELGPVTTKEIRQQLELMR